MHSLFFHCDVFFDKLSKLQQISFVILYYMEKRLLISGIDFHHSTWKLYEMRKIIALHLQSDCNWTRTKQFIFQFRFLTLQNPDNFPSLTFSPSLNIPYFQPIFGLMISQWGVKASQFWDGAFKNEYFVLNFSVLLTFIFLSLLVHEIQVWTLFDQNLG